MHVNLQALRWRHFGAATALLLVCLAISLAANGCASAALRSWGKDEVVLHGAGNAEAGHRNFSVLFAVKNVSGLKEDTYEVRQPERWDAAPSHAGTDGIEELAAAAPLSLSPAPGGGEWYWWDIKVAEVPPGKVRNPVSSFFKRTTGDGSVPGEFRRLGVSIVRDAARDYRVILWGENPRTNHWLRIGVVPVGRGTQSSLRPIVKFVFLPFALAIDIGLVPLSCAVLLLGLLLTVRRSVPMTLTIAGALLIACYPLMRASVAREQADIQRALAPLASMPLAALSVPGGREFALTIPTDSQWQRIIRRMGSPSFLVVAASPADVPNARTYPARELGLSATVLRNGSAVTVTPTSDTPYAYSADTENNGFKFAAEGGDQVRISAHATASNLPANAIVIVVANWGSLNTWDWVDGAAIGYGIVGILSWAAAGLGAVLIAAALLLVVHRRSVDSRPPPSDREDRVRRRTPS